MTNVNDAKFKAACEEYIREALADGLNREQVLARLEEMAKSLWQVDRRSSLFVQSSPWWKTKRGTLTKQGPLLFGGGLFWGNERGWLISAFGGKAYNDSQAKYVIDYSANPNKSGMGAL